MQGREPPARALPVPAPDLGWPDSPLPALALDAQGRALALNAALAECLGHPREALLQEGWWAALAPAALRPLQQALRPGCSTLLRLPLAAGAAAAASPQAADGTLSLQLAWQPEAGCHLGVVATLPALWQALADEQAQHRTQRQLGDLLPVMVAYFGGRQSLCRYANQAYAAFYGLDTRSIVGRSLGQVVGDAGLGLAQAEVQRMLAHRRTVTYTRCVEPVGGGPRRWVEVHLIPHIGAPGQARAGQVQGALVLVSDVTRFVDIERALRESEERLRKFLGASLEGIAFHRDGVVTDLNEPMAALLGRARETLIGQRVMDFIAPAHAARVREGMARLSELPYEAACLHADGSTLPVEIIARAIQHDGQPLRMVVVRDIRDRQAARVRMQHLAEHDSLTGLRNRAAFMAALQAAIEQPAAPGMVLALLFVDLDHFKRINDALGHLAGDALLRTVAERLRAVLAAVAPGAEAGRFGGDEFVILLPGLAGAAAARAAALRVHAAIAEPVNWGGRPMAVTPTIGVALHPADGDSADALLRHADAALYAGKAAGRAVVTLFEPAMAAAIEAGLQLEARIAQGLRQGEFGWRLQPRRALADGRLLGLQAELHWHHPERGSLGAAAFAPAAAQSGLLQPLLDWALAEALRLQAGWAELALAVPLSLNLAGLVSRAAGLADSVARALAALPPRAGPGLALELDAALCVDDARPAAELLQRLRALGVSVWLAEVGRGALPLGLLRQLPAGAVAGLLLDAELAAAPAADAAAGAVLGAAAALARGLGLPLCAPGVADGAQWQALLEAGCQQAQGPWVAPPMTPAEATAWLATQRR
ncbi:diguanylate cyclase domain-containing protein [Aquabacterium sp. OR-4]|uniref:diguanylate cyclase domain-containing protein n=1 Tax=Aquabacterium sp. OR-4 TaxID=2978127 RepID=UPI0028C6A90E|nr:diguanylate cyclase [Aquabacterium sp. OR-4]MDT7837419.1 diguanylate cyclase [Aquabacterium sp. OR-4]